MNDILNNNSSNNDMNGIIDPIPEYLSNNEQMMRDAISTDAEISPSPLAGFSETDLRVFLDKPGIPEALKLEAESRLAIMSRANDEVDTLGHGNSQVQAKTYSKSLSQFKNSRADDAGYVNIIILMLTVWATCLCGMAYVYSQLRIMG